MGSRKILQELSSIGGPGDTFMIHQGFTPE